MNLYMQKQLKRVIPDYSHPVEPIERRTATEGSMPHAPPFKLPQAARDHLSAYRASRGLQSDAEGLLEIIQTHMLIAEMSHREGHSMSTIAESTRIANEWHREGFRGEPVRVSDAASVAH